MLSASHLCSNPIRHMSSSCHFGLNPTFYYPTPWKQIGHDLSTWCWFRIEGLGYRDEGTLTTLRLVENKWCLDWKQHDTSFCLELGCGVGVCGLGFRQRWQQHDSRHILSHMWMSHVTHVDASRHTRGGVTSHVWMSDVTRWDEMRQYGASCNINAFKRIFQTSHSRLCINHIYIYIYVYTYIMYTYAYGVLWCASVQRSAKPL